MALLTFTVRRFLAMILILWIVLTIVFAMARLSPYDPIAQIMQQHYQVAQAAQIRHEFGLDQPMWKQYLNYVGGLLHGDLGKSESQQTLGQPVWSLLQHGVPVTMKLGFYALVLSLVVGLPVGLLSAIKQNSFVDHGSQAIMMVLYAVPVFVLVPLAQVVIGVQLRWLPVTGWGAPGVLGFKEAILPVTLYAAGLTGYFAKSYRSFLLEVLSQDYIRTARAKGLKARIILYIHAVKNTLVPLASIVGPVVAYLITGAFVIETFFGIPGIGYITVESIFNSDYSVIEATTLLLAAFVVLVNFLTDVVYALVDPRVRL
ncbi:MAG TPA: ABC transporter permease [Chloroflexota bacterium]|nr:ABC transporter permease [Chloroflexota bacterium]